MKFDKETIIGILICIVIVFGWGPFTRYMGWSKPAAQVQSQVQNETPAAPAPVSVTAPGKKVPEFRPAAPAKTEKPVVAPKLAPEILENADVRLTIDPVIGSIRAITLKQYKNHDRTADVKLDETVCGAGTFALFDPFDRWQCVSANVEKRSPDSVTVLRVMRNALNQDFVIRQSFSLAAKYQLKTSFTIENPGKTPVLFRNLVLDGGDLSSWAVLSGDKVRTPSHRLDYLTDDGSHEDIAADAADKKFTKNSGSTVRWVSLGNKYFVTILSSGSPFSMYCSRKTQELAGGAEQHVLNSGAQYPNTLLQPGKVFQADFRCYAGPKVIKYIDAFEPSAAKTMHLAWGPLDYLSRLLLWILVQLHAWLGSYGWSIILLTLFVRILFYPVTARANASMKKMQTVQPQLKALREKYKDNPQLLNTKTMELYREQKINPFGGCLPILLQIPVFFALYATLDGAVELRQESFWWIRDLAAADTVAVIPLYFFNLPLNPLVLAMTLLMIVQQRMMPSGMDPSQQKMMMLMPAVMLIFMYDMPSGLTLYWTVSNIFSILQMKLQQRNNRNQADAPAAKKN